MELPRVKGPDDAPSVAAAGGDGTSDDDTLTMFTAAAVPLVTAELGTVIEAVPPTSVNEPPDDGRITATSSAVRPSGTIDGAGEGSVGTGVAATAAATVTETAVDPDFVICFVMVASAA